MTTKTKAGSDPAPPVEDLTYEQAFQELEGIVAVLELEERTLDQALELYTRGQALARRCTTLLEQAELKVQQLSEDSLVEFPEQV
jgi:exodeoxyribonuclease VII small subunit